MLILQFISVFQIMYEPMIFKNGGPNNASISLMMLMYRYGYRDYNVPKASALSVMICIILMDFKWHIYESYRIGRRCIEEGKAMFFDKYQSKKDGVIRGYDIRSGKVKVLAGRYHDHLYDHGGNLSLPGSLGISGKF